MIPLETKTVFFLNVVKNMEYDKCATINNLTDVPPRRGGL
ncbi:MAG: hypothetical protein UV60_C0012G0002 [Parcubacteria group bacterium GW2011_GWA2_43_11]|nr:MAG: hypothetical protein UU89_C0020G0001 [Parcubacteria group bacterium GW2011_GWC2_42_11]KKS85010.1 MAG: hypothetical protein UV60_C0012G0002 [Parcubacteria group bacterium GW2011_GWA2_43_11]